MEVWCGEVRRGASLWRVAMAVCVSHMVAVSASGCQSLQVRAEADDCSAACVSRSVRSLRGRTRTSLRPSFFGGVAALESRRGLLTLSARRTKFHSNPREAFVCSAVASDGQSEESRSSPELPKPNRGLNVFLRLVCFLTAAVLC